MNDVCRLRHVSTGKYLSVSAIDRRDLVLTENTESSDSMFRIRRDTYRPGHVTKGGEVTHSFHDVITGHVVSSHDLVILETYHHTYIHLSESIKENFELVKGDAMTSGELMLKSQSDNKKNA